MITHVRGELVAKTPQSPGGPMLVVDVNGLGYEILTNARAVVLAPPVGEAVRVFTHLVVREDEHKLVGFLSREERDLFRILQRANGVGVKVALALLSDLSVPEIVQAVVSGEYKPLTTAKGIGPKLAQKITLELKEKMMSWREEACSYGLEETLMAERPALPQTEAFTEAEMVLLSLGYTTQEVLDSLRAVQREADSPGVTAELLLRESLKWLAKV